MKIYYKGKYNGDPASLPQREQPGAVRFRELNSMKKLAIVLNAVAGDYMNVFNCLTQVPKGAKVYNSGFHTYWYR